MGRARKAPPRAPDGYMIVACPGCGDWPLRDTPESESYDINNWMRTCPECQRKLCNTCFPFERGATRCAREDCAMVAEQMRAPVAPDEPPDLEELADESVAVPAPAPAPERDPWDDFDDDGGDDERADGEVPDAAA